METGTQNVVADLKKRIDELQFEMTQLGTLRRVNYIAGGSSILENTRLIYDTLVAQLATLQAQTGNVAAAELPALTPTDTTPAQSF